MKAKIKQKWARIWMRFAGTSPLGRLATLFACWGHPPFYSRIQLSKIRTKGFISPRAQISHTRFTSGHHLFIDDRVLIYEDTMLDQNMGGTVEFGHRVHLHRDTIIQTGLGGNLTIADDTHIQPRCQINAYKSLIKIGRHVEIAPGCALYSYDHGLEMGTDIGSQPIVSKGGITIEDDVWLGFGVIVLDGVTIGSGSVVGAGSIVTRSIPKNSIAVGNPAKVIKNRNHKMQDDTQK